MYELHHRHLSFQQSWRWCRFCSSLPKIPQNELLTSTLIYNTFQYNENDYIIGSVFDTDLNFYCEQNVFSGFLCKYFTEESFNEKISSLCSEAVLSFSLCHINILSIKSNLGDFDSVSYRPRADLATFVHYCESMFIEIDKSVFGSERNIIVGVIYIGHQIQIYNFSLMLWKRS